jgi:hypothetical protein
MLKATSVSPSVSLSPLVGVQLNDLKMSSGLGADSPSGLISLGADLPRC